MIKNVLVHLSTSTPRDVAGEIAVSVATSFGAHVSGLAFAHEPPVGSLSDCVSGSIISTYRAQQNAEAKRAIAAFEGRAKSASVTFDSRIISETMANASEAFGVAARHYDLSIIGQAKPDDDGTQSMAIQAALFGSGRPIVVVPYIYQNHVELDRVMVCWDGSRSAARAVGDALPFLRRAGHIDVVTVEKSERRNELRGAEIAEHLARHGLKINLKPLVAPDSDAANVILSEAADSETKLVVMGGFGHSRLREFVLGGVTRCILESMTVPVLMAH